ncbi:S-adenosyl-L-methionine-dependent methyltransferase [Cantharellus anzutake]|uniref:S-adenosyl-L-methionine-dependent methyltransferase n=1 Tax=Cantharellus anzutake TaxID=1750568 RepID=UPI001905445D|nr:S-adenosyl-L-methionine-dependent methyltransferase [Cantharellus anzutake]KAF8338241.1 S-adenosyl-L-methionine-dependent methyltransferase [Cantharellus anzutake]
MARGRKQRGKDRGGPAQENDGKPKYHDREKFVVEKTNERFEIYYKIQQIIPEWEWGAFMSSLREPLPTTFRLTGNRTTARELNDVIRQTYVPQLTGITWEDQPVPAPTQLPWYPDRFAWQLNVTKAVVRKSPEFRKFQNFLVYETQSAGSCQHDSTLLLDVEPHHTVLDMCAAPGSKTAQLLEALHSGTDMPSGVVIANDSDNKRSHMLVHQSSRLPSPSLMVTNLDASLFPSLKLPPSSSRLKAQKDPAFGTIPTLGKGKGRANVLLFDRILCDVPCSGDGTIRKNLQIWNGWQTNNAMGLHVLQLRILLRGMRLLAPSGRLVYSTCSLNPIENEAVLAAALNQYPGEFEILDVSLWLPGLERRPGMLQWNVAIDKSLTNFAKTWEEYQAYWTDEEKAKGHAKHSQTMFTPPNAKDLGLQNCIRIYPHLQDSGGFFVAILARKNASAGDSLLNPNPLKRTVSNLSTVVAVDSQKKAKTAGIPSVLGVELQPIALPEPPLQGEEVDVEFDEILPEVGVDTLREPVRMIGDDGEEKATKPNDGGRSFNEVPYTYLQADNEHIQKCLSVTHINPSIFPSSQLFARSATAELASERPKSLYFSNALVKDIIENNDYKRLRLINAGVKLFVRQEVGSRASEKDGEDGQTKSPYRFVSDGIQTVLPFVDETEGSVDAGLKELEAMLRSYYPLINSYDEEFRERVKSKATGSYLVRFLPGEWSGHSLRHPLLLPLWISPKSTALMADKHTKSSYCSCFFLSVAHCACACLEKISPHSERRNNSRNKRKARVRLFKLWLQPKMLATRPSR